MTKSDINQIKLYLQTQLLNTAMENINLPASDLSVVFQQLANQDIPRFLDEYTKMYEE
jgi:hypothetical protein